MSEQITDATKLEDMSYEQTFQKLEDILEQLNTHDIDLEKSVQLFEDANHLIRACQIKLGQAERRVEEIIKNRNSHTEIFNDQDSSLTTRPFILGKDT